MKGVLHHHHQRLFNAFFPAVQTREFQRRLVGLGPGVVEERAIQAGQLGQALGQPLLPVDAVEVGGMQQQAGLLSDGRHQPGMGMADIGHRHTGDGVQVFAALLVP